MHQYPRIQRHNARASRRTPGRIRHRIGHDCAEFVEVNQIAVLLSNSILPDNTVRFISEDEDGSYWFGTESGGAVKLLNGNWTVYNTSNSGLSFNWVSNILLSYKIKSESQSKNWFSLYGGGIASLNINSEWKIYKSPEYPLPDRKNKITFLLTDGNEGLWFGTFDQGIGHFNGDSVWSDYNTINLPINSNNFYSVIRDLNGNFWFASFGSGVLKYDNSNWIVYNTENSNLKSNFILTVKMDNSGKIWAGTDGGGISVFDGVNWITYSTENSSIPSNTINSIAFEGNKIWAGLSNWNGLDAKGVVSFDGNVWNHYSTSNSELPNNAVVTVFVDSKNTKWFGCFDGGLAILN